MKNLLLVNLLLLFISTNNVHSQINVGVKAGLNINDRFYESKATFNYPGGPTPTRIKLGYHFGVNVSYELKNSFSLTSGILYVNKGSSIDIQFFERPVSSWDNSTRKAEGHARENYNYLELPLQLSYKVWRGLRVYGGSYAAFGISGNLNDDYLIYKDGVKDFEYKSKERNKPVYTKQTIKTSQTAGSPQLLIVEYNPPTFNGFDYGVNLGIGYKFGNILLSSEYSWGLGNVTPKYTNFSRDIHQHRILYFSVGYLLFKK